MISSKWYVYNKGKQNIFKTYICAFHQEEKGLRETKQENDVNNAKSIHVTHDHSINHNNKRSSQFDGTTKKYQIKPGTCTEGEFSVRIFRNSDPDFGLMKH